MSHGHANVNDVADEQGTSHSTLDAVPASPAACIHAPSRLFFASWILINLSIVRILKTFDPYPFEFMSVIVSLEAIFLTLFVLTSQNRQRARDRIRSDIEFQTPSTPKPKSPTYTKKSTA